MSVRIMARLINPFLKLLDMLTPVGDLVARVWVAQIFLQAGLIKLQSWSTTLTLFRQNYVVPFFISDHGGYLCYSR